MGYYCVSGCYSTLCNLRWYCVTNCTVLYMYYKTSECKVKREAWLGHRQGTLQTLTRSQTPQMEDWEHVSRPQLNSLSVSLHTASTRSRTTLHYLWQREIRSWYPCTSGCVRLLGEQTENVLDVSSARVGNGSKLVWEYIGMPSCITTCSLFSVVGSKVISLSVKYHTLQLR